VILDLCSRFAVGWAMSACITDELLVEPSHVGQRPGQLCA